MSKDLTLTFTVNTRPAALAFKRFARALRQADRRINRTGPRPATSWRHRKGQARR